MRKLLFFFALITCTFFTSFGQSVIADQSFNKNWKFQLGTFEGAELPSFDDSSWRDLSLPHDWAIEGPFSEDNNCRTGALPVHGTAWYRKSFSIPSEMEGKQVSLTFDGAMNNAIVYVNGSLVGGRPFGYITFEVDLTKYVKFGEENLVAVVLRPEDLSARWYPGAGIYRNVTIKYNHAIHIPQWGTYITTPEVTDSQAKVRIKTTLKNSTSKVESLTLKTIILDPNGRTISESIQNHKVDGLRLDTIDQEIMVENPQRWDVNSPDLYTAKSEVLIGGIVVDNYSTEFGIRNIEFTKDDGFLLNGKRLTFQGACMHHDLGPLGAAFNYRARERQMEIMKSMGVNALRTSHNPPEPEWLEICDKLGIVVQVEAFDEWKKGKVPNGYNKVFDEWHERDLRDMIRRDRNHPSVIMWSIGNEILEQGNKDGWKITKRLNDICHEEDPTRPTTAGFNYFPAPFENGLAFEIDVVGLNYWPLQYAEVKQKYPDLIVYGSETSSMTSSRGFYDPTLSPIPDKTTGQVTSYDLIYGPPWAYLPDAEFDAQAETSASLGEFIWTGFDYLGEPTPYGGRDNSTKGYWNDDYPSHSSYFAPVDLCGFPKDRYYLYQSVWTVEPMVHVLPHWNWEGMEGKEIPVIAYSNCEEVELFVNGASMGRKKMGVEKTEVPAEFHFFEKGDYESKYRLMWQVPYQPGEIKVVGYNMGSPVAEKSIKSAGSSSQISLTADRNLLKSSGKDLSFVTVDIQDKEGIFQPLADNLVQFEIEGPGEILAVANGDPTDLSPFQDNKQKTFFGKCLVVIKGADRKGSIKLVATSEGLKSSEISISVQ